jgi:small conductance mechanosensitive channel
MPLARLFLFALALLMLPAHPISAQDAAPAEPATNGVAVEVDDAAISARVRAVLSELDGMDGASAVVRAGVVTLNGEVLDADVSQNLVTLVGRIDGVLAVQNHMTETTDIARRLNPAADRVASRISQIIALAPLLALALLAASVVIVLGFVLAAMRGPWERLAPNPFIGEIYRQIIRLFFVVVGVVLALDILGATALLGTILGAAGIIGLAIGFAVRDTVENFIASVMLSIRRPFSPNDLIEIDGDLGKVIRLTSRATILLSLDGNHIRIPNATVFKSRIINYTRNRERRFQFDIGVEYDCDLAAVRALIEETVQALPFVLREPAASAWIENMGDAGVIVRVTGWIDQHATSFVAARGSAIRHAKDAIEAVGVEIPDTTYRVRLDGALAGPLYASITESDTSATAAPKPRAQPVKPLAAGREEDVKPADEQALERMVDAERHDATRTDLLERGSDIE